MAIELERKRRLGFAFSLKSNNTDRTKKWEGLAWVRHSSTGEELDKFKCLAAKCRELQSFRWASVQAKLHPDWGPDLCESRRRAHSPIGVLRMSIVNILRGLLCRLESLRLKFTNEPSIFVDGDLAESIKRSASDRLGDLVP